MEYDVPSAGVRVSFIVRDGENAMPLPPARQFVDGVSKDGSWTAPQNLENKKVLIAMLEEMCSQEEIT
jgi:hypothetical protein